MTDKPKLLERVKTHIAGFDAITKGGLLKGGVYLLMAVPGSGKTILGNQVCFNHVADGGRAVYLSILTESHARMLASIGTLSFFDERRLSNEILYLSGYQALESEKLDGLLKLIRKAVRDQRATLLVIDGLVTASSIAGSDIALKEFIHGLQIFIEMVGCTTLLLTGTKEEESNYPERTMVDGLFLMTKRRVGIRTVREFEVSKFRSSDNVLGAHFFDISDRGISIYPRTEATLGMGSTAVADGLSPFSIAGLDQSMGGGLRRGSSTLLVGAPGSGKTTLGLQFLVAGAEQGEPGLYYGFSESNEWLRSRASPLNLGSLLDSGMLQLTWQAPLELLADALVLQLLETVKRSGIRRVFIDGIAGFLGALIYAERVSPFLLALVNELRSLGVTTLLSDETTQVFGEAPRLPEGASSVDNLVMVGYVDGDTGRQRLVSVAKMRQAGYESMVHDLSISSRGVEVGTVAAGVEKDAAPQRQK